MIVFVGAVFPLLINTYEGVKNVDRVLVNVVRSFGANEWQMMKIVVLPNSVPLYYCWTAPRDRSGGPRRGRR